MPEFETLLREALREAVPQDLEQSGLAEGAKAYAVRVRRLRVVSTAVVAAVVVLIAAVASTGMFRNRAVAPAKPQTDHVNVCDDQVGVTPLRAAPVAPASARYQHVLVCALTGSDSAWPGSLPPDWSVDTPEAIDSLTWDLRDDAADCGRLPMGRAFTVSVQEHNGTISTYLNTDLRCSGWEFLERYYVALAEQRWQVDTTLQDPFPGCPSFFGKQPPTSEAPLARGTVLSEASLCLHPVPRAVRDVPVPRWPVRGVLDTADLARLNAELAAHGSVSGRPQGGCGGTPADRVYVIRAKTSRGEDVELRMSPACATTWLVNKSDVQTFDISRTTFDAMTSPLTGLWLQGPSKSP